MIIETAFEQGTEEWLDARRNSVGSTGIKKIIQPSTLKRSASRAGYLYEKASEIITGRSKPVWQTYEMKWGHEHEPDARELFAFSRGMEVTTCAMVFCDENKNWHISPDGLMEDSGLEIKCPQLKAFDDYVEKGELPNEHKLQVQSCMALTGCDHWYYMVYFPGLKPMVLRIERDEEAVDIIRAEIRIFNRDLQKLITRLKG